MKGGGGKRGKLTRNLKIMINLWVFFRRKSVHFPRFSREKLGKSFPGSVFREFWRGRTVLGQAFHLNVVIEKQLAATIGWNFWPIFGKF